MKSLGTVSSRRSPPNFSGGCRSLNVKPCFQRGCHASSPGSCRRRVAEHRDPSERESGRRTSTTRQRLQRMFTYGVDHARASSRATRFRQSLFECSSEGACMCARLTVGYVPCPPCRLSRGGRARHKRHTAQIYRHTRTKLVVRLYLFPELARRADDQRTDLIHCLNVPSVSTKPAAHVGGVFCAVTSETCIQIS